MLRKSESECVQDRIGGRLVTDVWTGELVKGPWKRDPTDFWEKGKSDGEKQNGEWFRKHSENKDEGRLR